MANAVVCHRPRDFVHEALPFGIKREGKHQHSVHMPSRHGSGAVLTSRSRVRRPGRVSRTAARDQSRATAASGTARASTASVRARAGSRQFGTKPRGIRNPQTAALKKARRKARRANLLPQVSAEDARSAALDNLGHPDLYTQDDIGGCDTPEYISSDEQVEVKIEYPGTRVTSPKHFRNETNQQELLSNAETGRQRSYQTGN